MSEQVKCRTCEQNEREKASWGPGVWQDEPNRVQWEHAGLPCIAHRNRGGAWCGYVGLAPGHPQHGKSYHEVNADVHGGLTYGEPCAGCVCHVPKPGEPDDLFWFGFDCAHAWDQSPGMLAYRLGNDEHYWTLAEVQAETNAMAEQFAAMVVHEVPS
jgi:hypothetical protein